MPLTASATHGSLVEQLGIAPLPEDLLRQALTHSSFLNESDAAAFSNERLEFLGDAVLGMVIAHQLYRWFPEAGEGALTRMRAGIVRGTTLAHAAHRLGLGNHLILGKGEEAAGGRKRDRNLAGGLEALIGAVYQGQGYRKAAVLCRRALKSELDRVRREGEPLDPKSNLQHLVQARWHEPPEYVTVEESSSEAGRRFTVEVRVGANLLGRGSGASKREAQQHAAGQAVALLTRPGGLEG